ncbi:hypothetical protein TRFO_18190 [Tritrichomonas foetus]|uniref:Protein kinase domain-containing protein n=1 Tax=Tritrichomonas foetus TaxID=1144522 RepID=A0A1J4KLT7_9EUKA|nr:hypothetical protein TRFO_18190 [Tritrichomonas foetus]|eukprot:OHT12179.1 hypothetical protein TRFO_18190 [Tritrichomonas foetus]
MNSDFEINDILKPIEDFQVNYNEFKIGKSIGRGSYAEVFIAVHIPTNQQAAIKILHAKQLNGKDKVYFCREVKILSSLNNPFVLSFLGYSSLVPPFVVTEYIPKGSLYDAIYHQPGAPSLNSTHKSLIAIGIAYGMISVHKQGVIHRDLKSANILLDDSLLPKIIDFGLSKYNVGSDQLLGSVGTPNWMAPEMFEDDNYTEKIDVYSYGMILYEMLTEKLPFKGLEPVRIMMDVFGGQRPIIPQNCPKPLHQLIESCWEQDPTKRPSFEAIYELFISKQVYFPNTNLNMIDAMTNYIEKIGIHNDESNNLHKRSLKGQSFNTSKIKIDFI